MKRTQILAVILPLFLIPLFMTTSSAATYVPSVLPNSTTAYRDTNLKTVIVNPMLASMPLTYDTPKSTDFPVINAYNGSTQFILGDFAKMMANGLTVTSTPVTLSTKTAISTPKLVSFNNLDLIAESTNGLLSYRVSASYEFSIIIYTASTYTDYYANIANVSNTYGFIHINNVGDYNMHIPTYTYDIGAQPPTKNSVALNIKYTRPTEAPIVPYYLITNVAATIDNVHPSTTFTAGAIPSTSQYRPTTPQQSPISINYNYDLAQLYKRFSARTDVLDFTMAVSKLGPRSSTVVKNINSISQVSAPGLNVKLNTNKSNNVNCLYNCELSPTYYSIVDTFSYNAGLTGTALTTFYPTILTLTFPSVVLKTVESVKALGATQKFIMQNIAFDVQFDVTAKSTVTTNIDKNMLPDNGPGSTDATTTQQSTVIVNYLPYIVVGAVAVVIVASIFISRRVRAVK